MQPLKKSYILINSDRKERKLCIFSFQIKEKKKKNQKEKRKEKKT